MQSTALEVWVGCFPQRSRDNSVSRSLILTFQLHLQDEVEHASGHDGRRGGGFSGQPECHGRDTPVQTPTPVPRTQPGLPGEEPLFMLDVLCQMFVLDVSYFVLFPVLRHPPLPSLQAGLSEERRN